jgi:hypothetical protein
MSEDYLLDRVAGWVIDRRPPLSFHDVTCELTELTAMSLVPTEIDLAVQASLLELMRDAEKKLFDAYRYPPASFIPGVNATVNDVRDLCCARFDNLKRFAGFPSLTYAPPV